MDYRVAWAPDGESFRGAGDSDWNDHPTGTSMTIMGLVGWDDYKVKVRARFDTTPKADWSSCQGRRQSVPLWRREIVPLVRWQGSPRE